MDQWFFFKKLRRNLLIVLPIMILLCYPFFAIEFDSVIKILYFVVSEIAVIGAAVVIAYDSSKEAAKRGIDWYIARKLFRGFSKKARLFSEGMECVRCGELADSIEFFKDMLELKLTDKEKAAVSFYLANSYRLMGYDTNAINYFRNAIDLGIDDRTRTIEVLLARCYVETRSYDKAIEIYDKLEQAEICFEFIYTDYGMCYLSKGDYETALEWFQKSVINHRNAVFALGGCSLAHLGMKELEESDRMYRAALAANLSDVEGFKQYYCKIAESVGLYDEINDDMKRK